MNILPATLASVTVSEHLSSLCVRVQDDLFTLLLAEPSQDRIGDTITLAFKETEILLSKSVIPSTANAHAAAILRIERGTVLSEIELAYGDTALRALVPTATFDPLELHEGDTVGWMVSPAEISLLRGE